MEKKQYIDRIIRKINCGVKKKEDIRKQLELDIDYRINEGETLEHIIMQMGTEKEIAESFNDNLSSKEKKIYVRNRVLKISILIMATLIIGVIAVNRVLPKTADINDSLYFKETQVEEQIKVCIEMLDDGNYTDLQAMSIEQLQATLTNEVMGGVKNQISNNWGERISYGNIYMTELTQNGSHFAVCEITVSYENVTATYRLTFDEDMKLAGMYMR